MEVQKILLKNKNSKMNKKIIFGVFLFLTIMAVILAVKFLSSTLIDSQDFIFSYIYFLSYFLMFWFIIQQSFGGKVVWSWFILVNIFFIVLFFELYTVVKFIIILQLIFVIIMNYYQIEELKEKNDRIQYLSYHDGLTGVHNRRYLQKKIKKLKKIKKDNLSVIIADINNLKYVNDSFGHHQGDEYIKKAARILSSELRNKDIIARTGGDEFAILLPETSKQDCQKIIKRFKQKIKNQDCQYFSIAFGCATKNYKFDSLELMINQADQKMYENKEKMKKDLSYDIH